MSNTPQRDTIFNKPLSSVKAFEFNQEVVQVFDDMIQRSVPGYDLLLRLIALYAEVFVQNQSQLYDLGCSTGLVSRILQPVADQRGCRLIAVDNSKAMIERCRERDVNQRIDWRCQDIESVDIEDASLVVLNLTLQFVDQNERTAMLQRVFRGLHPGGALVLTEKVLFDNENEQTVMTELYQGFKKIQGYSDLEIANKRSALDQVLVPESRTLHLERLRDCGFDPVYEVFHCFNFVSMLAIKNGS